MLILQRLLRRIHYPPLKPQILRPLEYLIRAILHAQPPHRIHNLPHLPHRLRIPPRQRLPARRTQIPRQIPHKPLLIQPRQQMKPLLLSARRKSDIHIPPIPAQHLHIRRRRNRRMPPRLPLNRLARHQPVIRAPLGRHILRRVHIHIYELTLPRELPMHQRRQYPDCREMASRMIRLIPPAAHRRQRMIVIPATPRRPPKRQRRQIRGCVIAIRRRLPKRTYRRHHNPRRHP